MKIAQSNVNLVSSNHYYEENSVAVKSGVVSSSSFLDNLQNQEKVMEEKKSSDEKDSGVGDRAKDGEKTVDKSGSASNHKTDQYVSTRQAAINDWPVLGSENYNSLKPSKSEYGMGYETNLVNQISQMRARLLEKLMSFLQILCGGSSTSKNSWSGLTDTSADYMGGLGDGNMGLGRMFGQAEMFFASSGMVRVTSLEMRHVEEESTTFSGQGIAKTEDGREIDFNVDFSLSRRLTVAAGISMASAVNFIDPLVINVGSDITSISDQSFFFDLDCDGVEEKVAGLGAGSGFLSYDRNGDGKINDGSELFGTKSGDGFADLSELDSDGNGWIDENDEAYGKLQVWLRGEDGVDRLLSLQEADVGAIFLGSASTEYSMYAEGGSGNLSPVAAENTRTDQRDDASSNYAELAGFGLAAMMRSSGLFLRESGGVGTVHQVDLARL